MPTWNNSPKFLKLQRKWYDKLKSKGFKDLEQGKDFNKFPASTMPMHHCSMTVFDRRDIGSANADGSNPHGDEMEFAQDVDNPDNPLHTRSVAESERALYWQEVGKKVNDLPDSWPGKKVLLYWSECGSMARAAKEYGWERKKAARTIQAFLRWAGLPVSKTRGPKQVKEVQAKVMHLAGTSGGLTWSLPYKNRDRMTPPKQIKDKDKNGY